MTKRVGKDTSPADAPVALGEFIHQARAAQGMTARALAATINMHFSYVSRLEAGDYQHPSPEVVQRIATALSLPYEDLFALAGHQAPEGLPGFLPYMRAKFEMSDETARQLAELFNALRDANQIRERPWHAKRRKPVERPELGDELPDVDLSWV